MPTQGRLFEEFDKFERDHDWTAVYTKLRDDATSVSHFKDARRAENVRLNRYRDVLPYDHTRVHLKPAANGDGSDYINASKVTIDAADREHILTQGPLHSTAAHFWQMVWEQNSMAVIMLNRIFENNQQKCHQYFPESHDDSPMVFDDADAEVHFCEDACEKSEHFKMRTLELRKRSTGEARRILHFQFLTWPDFGVPKHTSHFLEFLHAVRRHGCLNDPAHGPSVIHCSAGIGRSGSFILVDAALVIAKRDGVEKVNMLRLVKELRRYRMGLIQTPDQLRFSWKTVIDALENSEWKELLETGLPPPGAPRREAVTKKKKSGGDGGRRKRSSSQSDSVSSRSDAAARIGRTTPAAAATAGATPVLPEPSSSSSSSSNLTSSDVDDAVGVPAAAASSSSRPRAGGPSPAKHARSVEAAADDGGRKSGDGARRRSPRQRRSKAASSRSGPNVEAVLAEPEASSGTESDDEGSSSSNAARPPSDSRRRKHSLSNEEEDEELSSGDSMAEDDQGGGDHVGQHSLHQSPRPPSTALSAADVDVSIEAGGAVAGPTNASLSEQQRQSQEEQSAISGIARSDKSAPAGSYELRQRRREEESLAMRRRLEAMKHKQEAQSQRVSTTGERVNVWLCVGAALACGAVAAGLYYYGYQHPHGGGPSAPPQ